MSQGRGSASLTMSMVTLMTIVCMLVLLEHANAATYNVGGPGGWTYNTASWPKGKSFRAGDLLIFNYDSTSHNVVAVDRTGYNSCKTPGGAKVFTSGKDQIRLAKGVNYFICNYPGHCESGMKVAITAV
ncbi:unnamed protein product [Lupinus luteus]|uniref:Basic blue protein n=1 Tax=Lupinus luteus TaxID=3873 RepID=A0AAV1XE60_LUPLU